MDPLRNGWCRGAQRRRGVLLLVVLSVLTLFLMLGVAYLSIATRAHKSAHAFANNAVGDTAAGMGEIQLVDAAFMAVARGTTATLTSGTALTIGEDLLGDKYGHNSAITGRIVSGTSLVVVGTGTTNALIELKTAGLATTNTGSSSLPTNVSDLNGRVLTLLLPGLCTSTRILQASGSVATPKIIIAAGPTASGQTLSQTALAKALTAVSGTQPTLVINGREFSGDPAPSSLDTNEPWDGFDARNPLLTRILSGTIPTVTQAPLYSGTNPVPLSIDNDGDGVADSRFLDIGLPPLVDSFGRTVYPRAAVLVVDLDGRMNVNAHGSNIDAETLGQYPTLTTGSSSPDTFPLEQLPRGAPAGPAGVSLVRGLAFNLGTTSTSAILQATRFTAGRTPLSNTEADALSGRETPRVGSVEGRYGDAVWNTSTWTGTTAITLPTQPGSVGLNDYPGALADQWRASLDTATNRAFSYFTSPGRFGAPGDLHGTMRVWVDGFGQPVYYKPVWYQASGFNDAVDDPFEVNLTRRGGRTGYSAPPFGATKPADNLFAPADLEGLLRYWDPDSLRLGRRLVVLSGTDASRNRLVITTESWDTSAVAGTHWKTVVGGTLGGFISTSGTATGTNRPQDLFAPEVLLGHRMDINRPFHDTLTTEPNDATGNKATAPLGRRQIFARQLYCLMVSIARANNGGTLSTEDARKLAQYAVNVVDFRDADSVMTKFFYDPNFGSPTTTAPIVPTTTWSPGSGDFVWGCERPELLITETLAWHNRRTDDLSVGNKIVASSNADNDLDQSRRPWGAFFFELYSPWKSQAKQLVSGTVGNVTLSPSGTARGEPVPASLTTGSTSPFSTNGTITLSLTTPTADKTPVWRLVSVRGNVEGGTAFDAQGKFVDPAAANSTAKIDRAFYFAPPPAALRIISGTGMAGVYWSTAAATVEPSQSQYVVAGPENLIFDFHNTQPNPKGDGKSTDPYFNDQPAPNPLQGMALGYINQVPLRFNASASISGRTAPTLSEPTAFDGSEPYEVMAKLAHGSNNKFTPDFNAEPHWYDDSKNPISLQHAVDSPLDGYFLNGNTAVSPQFFVKGSGTTSTATPLLMLNGTHDNFAVMHLQRLANPSIPWDGSTNPYLTVDSMTVDLTVINTMNAVNNSVANPPTGYTQANVDDPLFAKQRNYRFQSAERGGKWTDLPSSPLPPSYCDIWSSRVRADASPAPSLVMTASNSLPERDATPLIASPTKQLQASTGYGTTAFRLKSTLREFTKDTSGQPLTGLPSRFYANGGSETSTPRFPWLGFFNRPFNSVYELALVPVGSPTELLQSHSVVGSPAPTSPFGHLPGFFEDAAPPAPWNAVTGRSATNAPSLFDFLHVPSPFAGVSKTVVSGTATPTQRANRGGLDTVGLDVLTLNQLSDFREPGRVNVNTITDARTWRALFGGLTAQGDADVVSPNFFDTLPGWDKNQLGATVLQNPADLFLKMPDAGSSLLKASGRNGGYRDSFVSEDTNGNGLLDPSEDANGNGSLDLNNHRNTDRHVAFRYQTMNQLSGVVTVRSNVFAVWVTIGYFSDANGTIEMTPVERNRGFYIFDRSIPVAYERGQNHNVRDAILLRRIIE